jgi:hypothetical protein
LLTFWGNAKKLEDKTLSSAKPSLSPDRRIGVCFFFGAMPKKKE